ncbi:unnamed protein product [Rotaria magnacalcarata]|nr:unnamed protein product [Rotaria magnacalcarata]
MQSKKIEEKTAESLVSINRFFHETAGNHLMSPLQATSAAYNPMAGTAGPSYVHPYGSNHHQAPPMHGLPPNHAAAAAAVHMHAVHHPGQQAQHNLSIQQNPHMMSVQNGPVILVSNLNEDFLK